MDFDVIVVGARVAGAPTAMLLARRGHRVLLLDRATFPSDVVSTHLLHVPAMALLRRWGLESAVVASGAPPLSGFTMDFGPFVISGPPPAVDGAAHPFCVRRTVLDKILLDAAAAAGATVREATTVTGLLRDGTGRVTGVHGEQFEAHAPVVVGADGLHSVVARETGAWLYDATPSATACYYAYYRGVSGPGAEIYQLGDRAVVVFPTNDGLACVFVACPVAQFHDFRADIEGNFLAAVARVPGLAERVAAGERTERFRGTADVPNFLRTSHGPGWALVGDAGYHKDPCTASGITDAFVGASMLADAIHEGLPSSLDTTLAEYQRRRDERFLPALHLTRDLASMEPPTPQMAALFAAIAASPAESTRFFGAMQGSTPIPEYFAPDNIARIMQG
jgi:flavin-dependent dehydrogenase